MKEFEGKEVYLRPTGNNVPLRSQYGDGCRWGTVVKVNKVNVTVQFADWHHTRKLRISENGGRRLDDNCNAGWIVYEDRVAYLNDLHKENIARRISEQFSYTSRLEQIGLEKLERIASILGLVIIDS